MAVGVGVALAKAEHKRRSARQRLRDRRFALLPGELLGDGLQRIALGQLDLAIDLLAGEGGAPHARRAVHETRKALKRLRALIRLLEDELGRQAFARENAALRDAGRNLASARDTEVVLATLDGLLARHPGKLAHRRGVAKLRARLAAERDRAADDAAARAQVLADLRATRSRVAAWRLSEGAGMQAVEPSLRRLYRRGRRRYARAARGKGERTLAMHEWRKRVKDLRYAAEILDRPDPDHRSRTSRSSRGRKRTRGRGDAAYIHRLAERADELGEVLGEEHDLALLSERVRAERKRRGGAPRPTREILLKLIARRRKRLRREALRAGSQMYRRKPKKFARRVRAAYGRGARA